MRIRSDRRFGFDADREEVWSRIGAVDQYPRWWPWLRDFEATGLVRGDAWRCVVRPPLPYVVRFVLRLDEVEAPGHVTATISGDIAGTARIDLVDRPGDVTGCEVRLRSELAPTHRVLRVVAGVAAPVARFGHDWVLDTGARQFADRLGNT